jgi:PAS domain S-box-containing protein
MNSDFDARASAQAYLQMATRVSRLGWWTIELPGRKLTWSDETCVMHDAAPGFQPSLAEGLETFLPEHRASVARHVERCATQGNPYDFVLPKNTVKGRRIWVRCIGEAVRNESGVIVRIQGAFQDVTELKLAEAQLQKAQAEIVELNAELESRVQQRTAQLELANRELVTANRELETFSYSVSHDLRAPLIAINGFSQLLSQLDSSLLDATNRHFLERIQQGTCTMEKLIESLLSLAYLSRKKLELGRVDLSRLMRQIEASLRKSEPGRVVEVTIEPGLEVTGDRALLTNLLENLLANAWKFSACRDVARIAFGLRTDTLEGPFYFISDNGAGFDMAHYAKLFKAFERLHSPTDFPGTGIGLAIIKRVVERHGGRVYAQGQVGEGATFYFTLPLIDIDHHRL